MGKGSVIGLVIWIIFGFALLIAGYAAADTNPLLGFALFIAGIAGIAHGIIGVSP
jgi:hypothetical protein